MTDASPAVAAPAAVRILVVDDDAAIREFVALALRLSDYDVVFGSDGETVTDLVLSERPRLIIMDLSMPGISGIEALQRLRSIGSELPVIMLTAHDGDDDKLAAFDAGADDYLVKPLSARELVARVAAVLRRSRLGSADVEPPNVVQAGPLTIIPATHTASINGRNLSLTRLEYSLLVLMARTPGRIFTSDELLTRVWGPEYHDQAEILRTNIYRLRHKLEDDPRRPRYVCTRPGVGYYFSPD
jgi:DNA-binding response OmpR family regulator